MFRWCERCFGHFKRCVIVVLLSRLAVKLVALFLFVWNRKTNERFGYERVKVVEKSSCFIGITLCFSANTHVIGLSSSFIEKS
mmetsp:Transcript_22860/g.29278  ORF Transcript_22860/g.29278 Transcript_22860/m.29278 type:complete len:83 (+) Transcript_22860:129-377(+)